MSGLHFLMALAIFGGWSSLTEAKDPLCSASLTIPTGLCCPRDYSRYCCSGIPVCSDGLNITDERVYFETPPCSSPWKLSACLGGFYSTDGINTIPCPPGYFCEVNSVCLKPCPVGAYCIQNKLVSGNCSLFKKCCLPDNTSPIYINDTQSLKCAAQFYPVRCQAGSYCSNTTSMLKCPSGHFCREGSFKPTKCPVIFPCGEGETSPNTLYVGLIINGCLLFSFLFILLYFNNRHAVNFYCMLYKERVTGKRGSSHRFNLSDGIRLAINRINKFDNKGEMGIEPKEVSYNISFEKLSLKLTSGANKGKVLLQGVTGEINAGEVTAVLGPSGAGKTTFLNVLCGKAYYGEAGGTIKINGKEVKGIQDYKSLTGFVPQDDIMHRSLTVYEVLYYNALLRLPPQKDATYYTKMVKKVLNLLGIRHVANTQIGDEEIRGISGGQRRRVNIGMELVADPTILFLDEPTTGLDSASSLAVVKSLNAVASKGNLTVLCVIHQPRYEILKMFDKVLLLGHGGRTVYLGSVEDAEPYFSKVGFPLPPYVNPADFYMDVIAGTIKSQLPRYTDLFQEWENHLSSVEVTSSASSTETTKIAGSSLLLGIQGVKDQTESIKEIPSPPATSDHQTHKLKTYRPSFFVQLWIFMKREFVLQLHMAKTLLLDQALAMVAGSILGLLFREVEIHNVPESTVFGDIAVGLVGVVAALRSFGHRRVVFWRESASGINRVSYFLAVNLAYIPILLISPAVYLSIYFSIASFLAPFGMHYAVFLCAWFYLSGLGYVMSLMMTPRNSQMAAIITVVIMALLSGGSPELCKLDETFIGTAIYNLSFSRWVAEAIFEVEAHERSAVLSDIISRVQIDNHYDLANYNICIVALISMGLGFRVIALLLLLFTKRGQQK